MALHNGVDLVFELPTVFAVQSAEGFARGAISILEATKVVDYLCFGSESGKLYLLQEIAKELQKEPPNLKKNKVLFKKGLFLSACFFCFTGIWKYKSLDSKQSKTTGVTQ